MENPLQKVELTARRPKMEPVAAQLDRTRARVLATNKPTLGDLLAKFGGWAAPELSGKVKS